MNEKINELKTELFQKIKEVDINRAEVLFRFELGDVGKFFETDTAKMFSERFFCRGLQWSILAQNNRKDVANANTKHLGFYLHCHNDEPAKWSCKVKYQLILFARSPEKQKACRLINTWEKKTSFGSHFFISYIELMDKANGYVQDDKVLLGVGLEADPVVRD